MSDPRRNPKPNPYADGWVPRYGGCLAELRRAISRDAPSLRLWQTYAGQRVDTKVEWAESTRRLILRLPEHSTEMPDGPTVDRWISRLGHQWPRQEQPAERPRGESRPKETEETAPATGAGNGAKHGGGGNSGEVDCPAETEASDVRATEDQGAAPGTGSGPREADSGDDQRGAVDVPSGPGGKLSGSGGLRPQESPESRVPDPSRPDDGGSQDAPTHVTTATPDRSAERSAEAKGADSSDAGQSRLQDHAEDASSLGAEGNESLGVSVDGTDPDAVPCASTPTYPRRAFGGVWYDPAAVNRFRREATRMRAARRARSAFERLFRALRWDPQGQEQTPRVDGRRLVRELVSSRYQLSRARRRELNTGTILLLCDVSGSCSAVADETLAAALTVADHLRNVAVICHSNGTPLWHYGAEVPYPPNDVARGEWPIEDVWSEQLAGEHLVGSVALGDWDAGWLYEQLAAVAPLVWLDSDLCAHDGASPARRLLTMRHTRWATRPLAHYHGVGCVHSLVRALHLIAADGGKAGRPWERP